MLPSFASTAAHETNPVARLAAQLAKDDDTQQRWLKREDHAVIREAWDQAVALEGGRFLSRGGFLEALSILGLKEVYTGPKALDHMPRNFRIAKKQTAEGAGKRARLAHAATSRNLAQQRRKPDSSSAAGDSDAETDTPASPSLARRPVHTPSIDPEAEKNNKEAERRFAALASTMFDSTSKDGCFLALPEFVSVCADLVLRKDGVWDDMSEARMRRGGHVTAEQWAGRRKSTDFRIGKSMHF